MEIENVDHTNPPHSQDDLSSLKGELAQVAAGRARLLQFEVVYARVYRLVVQKDQGQEVYDFCGHLFRRMAVMSRKRYDIGVRLIVNVCMYLEKVWVRGSGHKPLHNVAAEVYVMPSLVAKRQWRKACRLVVWNNRFRDWLVVFNEHAFALGGYSAARVADHFAAFVAQHEP